MSTIRVRPLAPSKTVLLLVDFVNPLRFDGAAQLAPSALAAAQQTAALRRRLAREGVRTVYTNDNYGMWTLGFKELWQRCAAMRGSAGQLARLLAPTSKDFTLLKARHSAFHATALDILLQQLRCKRLIVTGIAADNCVLFSAMDAYLRGYSLSVPVDCVAAETAQARDEALQHMARVLKADVRPSARLKSG
jgi:nicotinamidase-related amidase